MIPNIPDVCYKPADRGQYSRDSNPCNGYMAGYTDRGRSGQPLSGHTSMHTTPGGASEQGGVGNILNKENIYHSHQMSGVFTNGPILKDFIGNVWICPRPLHSPLPLACYALAKTDPTWRSILCRPPPTTFSLFFFLKHYLPCMSYLKFQLPQHLTGPQIAFSRLTSLEHDIWHILGSPPPP